MNGLIQLKVVHGNRLFRECLVQSLSRLDGIRAVAVDPTDPQCLGAIAELSAEVILLDLNLPGQLAAVLARRLREQRVPGRVLLLVSSRAHGNLLECIAAGVHGCILEQSSIEELRIAVQQVVRGEMFCSPEILDTLWKSLLPPQATPRWRQPSVVSQLTGREQEILELISQRLSNKQIAHQLSLSLNTVKNHVHRVLEKLQVEDRKKAVERAQGLPRGKTAYAAGTSETAT